MGTPFLVSPDESLLLVVDMQARLAGAMEPTDYQQIRGNVAILVKAAVLLGIPLLATEQYPKGLGATDTELAALFPADLTPIDKTSFSCCAVPDVQTTIASSGRHQLLVVGMEAHICVLQTALELSSQGYSVFVPEDGVCSRNPAHRSNAMARMRASGVLVTLTESVLFEWLRDATHEHFKAVTGLLK